MVLLMSRAMNVTSVKRGSGHVSEEVILAALTLILTIYIYFKLHPNLIDAYQNVARQRRLAEITEVVKWIFSLSQFLMARNPNPSLNTMT